MRTGIDIFSHCMLHPEDETRYDLWSSPVVHMASLHLVGIAGYSSLVAPCLHQRVAVQAVQLPFLG